jgi:imidazolonepropionase-like amidohydrolase
MTPQAALVAATAGGAEALGIDAEVGTVTVGKLADLVLVAGDPISDPGLLGDRTRIELVFRNGAPVAGTRLEASL